MAGVIVSASSSISHGRCWNPYVRPSTPAGDRLRGPRRPSADELARRAADKAISLAPNPDLRIAPARRGLTGLDSYFWLAERPRSVHAIAGVPGLTVTAEAHPGQYVWSFGDGREKITNHPGRRWTRRQPGNIAHLYETKDRYEVTVEVVWEARYRINRGSWRALGFFTTSDSVIYPVREMVSVLVRSR